MPGCHPGVAARFAAGARISVSARASAQSGKRARQQAAQDAVMAVASLAQQQIIDVRQLIPSEEEIQDALAGSTDILVAGTGRWTFFDWTSPDGSVMLSVCSGSGTKTDDDGVQPVLKRLQTWIQNDKPCLVWAKMLDRFGRDELGLGQIVRTIDRNSANGAECWLGAGNSGIKPRYPGWDIDIFFSGRQSRIQAEDLTTRSRATMAKRTSTSMSLGRFVYAYPNPLPAGLAHARLRDQRGGQGPAIGYLDAAQWRPSSNELFTVAVPILDASGNVADQVDCVRWALAAYADGLMAETVGAVLMARGFTTEQFQRRNGRGTSYLTQLERMDPTVAGNIRSSLLSRLDLYETGVLNLRASGYDVTVAGCMPPGGWAEPAVLAKLHTMVERSERAASHRARSSLAGITVEIAGKTAKLAMMSATCHCKPTLDLP